MGEDRQMIKVLHVMDKLSTRGSSIHGVTRAMSWWGPRFDPKEIKIGVCSLKWFDPGSVILSDAGVELDFLEKGRLDPTTLHALLKVIDSKKPDVLHLHGYGASNFGRIAGAMRGIPRIVHEHGIIPHQPKYQDFADFVLSPLTTKAIAVSDSVREFMVQKRYIPESIIDTFFVGLPLEDYRHPSQEDIAAVREEFDINSDDPVVCTVGRLDPAKGQVFLLEAAAKVLPVMPNVRFLLVGDGPDLGKLEALVDDLGLQGNVILTGHRTDVPRLLGVADVVAMPSLWEGKPISLLEAMSLSKPVVATPPVLSSDVMKEGDVGLLVPPRDPEALAEGLLTLLRDPNLAKELGNRAKIRSADYDVSRTVARLARIYRDLVPVGVRGAGEPIHRQRAAHAPDT